jgi:hypothetical protein
MGKNFPAAPTRLSSLPARFPPIAAKLTVGDVGPMFFLLRMAFWLGLVLILLPTGSGQQGQSNSDLKASEAISAASATVQDMRSFCTREPDACTVGSQVASAIGHRAQAGAKMLYEALNEAMAPRETGTVPSAPPRRVAGAKPVPEKSPVERTSQSTLTPADLVPSWRAPQPHKDSKHPA